MSINRPELTLHDAMAKVLRTCKDYTAEQVYQRNGAANRSLYVELPVVNMRGEATVIAAYELHSEERKRRAAQHEVRCRLHVAGGWSAGQCASLVFHLGNFHAYENARTVKYPEDMVTVGGGARVENGEIVRLPCEENVLERIPYKRDHTRLVFQASPWTITMDNDRDSRMLFGGLQGGARLALTHVGKLNQSGDTFDAKDGIDVLEQFQWFLRFCRGGEADMPIVVGRDSQDQNVGENWHSGGGLPCETRDSWFPRKNPIDVENLFASFRALWQRDDASNHALRTAVWRYVCAHQNSAGDGGSVIHCQTALEWLVSTEIEWLKSAANEGTEQEGMAKAGKEARKLPERPFSIRLRWWLGYRKCPNGIPSSLEELRSWVERVDSSEPKDIALAIPRVRNSFIHFRETRPGAEVVRQASLASVWCLELALLSLMRYRGRYVNRLTAQEEYVPWATCT